MFSWKLVCLSSNSIFSGWACLKTIALQQFSIAHEDVHAKQWTFGARDVQFAVEGM